MVIDLTRAMVVNGSGTWDGTAKSQTFAISDKSGSVTMQYVGTTAPEQHYFYATVRIQNKNGKVLHGTERGGYASANYYCH
jgi:hypothetical protein